MNDPATLYEQIGGAEVVSQLVDDFYGRVLADPQLRPFFEGTSVEKLKRMQKEFFAAALDGPVEMSDFDLAAIHQGLGISLTHLTHFVNHLMATIDEHSKISSRDAMSIIFRIATFSDEIVDSAGGTDG